MPLFMQPGYRKTAAAALVTYPTSEASSVDVQLRVQDADYGAPPNFAQLNLLDRRDVGLEVGGSRRSDDAMLRFYMRLDASEYASQKSFELLDPFRRDRTYRAGFSWQREGDVFFRGNLEAIANRSNSKRPEYNTVRAEAHVQLPLSRGYSVQVLAILANKSYIHDTQFLRLVPGEEADNRSEVWLGISRQVAEGLDARLQLEWARAETDLSDAYFRSYGLSIALEYRPSW